MFNTYYADVLITLMLGWIRGLTDWIWRLISLGDGSAGRSFLGWFSANWFRLVLVLVIVGVVVDWLVWLIRWRPYWLWFGKKRRVLDDTKEPPARAKQPASVAGRPQAPRFTGKAIPGREAPQPQAEFFEEDELFDVVSPAISGAKQNAPQAREALVGVSVQQYIQKAPRAQVKPDREKPKKDEIEWSD
ncbi:MAG: hypothetical protein Q4A66_04805 [Eubacteriales bacterium]|nr:hypothetical protein [Eubacteriales bacterium]